MKLLQWLCTNMKKQGHKMFTNYNCLETMMATNKNFHELNVGMITLKPHNRCGGRGSTLHEYLFQFQRIIYFIHCFLNVWLSHRHCNYLTRKQLQHYIYHEIDDPCFIVHWSIPPLPMWLNPHIVRLQTIKILMVQ